MKGPYLSVLPGDRARISCIKMEKYSVISRKLITWFPIIFISVKTEFTLHFFIYEKVVRLWPHLSHRLLRPCRVTIINYESFETSQCVMQGVQWNL